MLLMKVSLGQLIQRNINQMLHAMHDAGKLSEKSLNEMLEMIFTHFSKEDLKECFSSPE